MSSPSGTSGAVNWHNRRSEPVFTDSKCSTAGSCCSTACPFLDSRLCGLLMFPPGLPCTEPALAGMPLQEIKVIALYVPPGLVQTSFSISHSYGYPHPTPLPKIKFPPPPHPPSLPGVRSDGGSRPPRNSYLPSAASAAFSPAAASTPQKRHAPNRLRRHPTPPPTLPNQTRPRQNPLHRPHRRRPPPLRHHPHNPNPQQSPTPTQLDKHTGTLPAAPKPKAKPARNALPNPSAPTQKKIGVPAECRLVFSCGTGVLPAVAHQRAATGGQPVATSYPNLPEPLRMSDGENFHLFSQSIQ